MVQEIGQRDISWRIRDILLVKKPTIFVPHDFYCLLFMQARSGGEVHLHKPPLTRAMIIGTGDQVEPLFAAVDEPPGVDGVLKDELFVAFSTKVAATASGVSA
jgi:hypothetical protein